MLPYEVEYLEELAAFLISVTQANLWDGHLLIVA